MMTCPNMRWLTVPFRCCCIVRIPVEKQVIIIYAVVSGQLLDVPANLVGAFEKELFAYIDGAYGDIPEAIRTTKQLDDDTKEKLSKVIEEFKTKFLSEH